METSDPDCLFREFLRTGNPSALGGVYDLLAPELLRIALHTTADAAQAEDVLQATFLVAIEDSSRFDPARRVLPWLVGILANEAKKTKARNARLPDPSRLEQGPGLAPHEEVERKELLAQLDQALERIPAAFRPVLQLRLRHGLSVTEIAEALDRPSGTVRSQLSRGIEGLRRTLPAGLARGLIAIAPPTRGLEGVRAALIEHVSAVQSSLSAGSISTATVLRGALAVNKLAALAAFPIALAIAAISFVLVARPRETPAVALQGEDAPRIELQAPADTLAHSARALSYEREAQPGEPELPPPAVDPAAVDPQRFAELSVLASWPDGAPAAGEVVLVHDAVGGRADEARLACTSEQGAALFSALAPGTAYVRLLRGGEASVQLVAGRKTSIELAIRSGVTVAGTVVDASGDPVAGAEVWLSERYRCNIGHVVAHADHEGAFEVRAVSADQWIGARMRGFAPSGLRQLGGGRGDRREIELVLAEEGELLRGLVLDSNGKPIPGAQVLVGDEEPAFVRVEDGSSAPSAPPQRTRTDPAGRFELHSTPQGLQPVQVRAKGCSPHRGELEILEGEENQITVMLSPAPRVVGRVQGPDGEPLASTWIFSGETERFASSSTWSRVDGSFELNDLCLGQQTLVARHKEAGDARLEIRLGPGETREWNVELRATPAIRGRIVDRNANALSGLVVVAIWNEDRSHRSRSEQSDEQGRFAITDLDPRAYTLWVQPPETGWRGFPLLEEKDVWPGPTPLELCVSNPTERGRILAEIEDCRGNPVAGAELQIWHETARMWRSFASEGERGAVIVEGVPPGTVELEFRHPDHPWKRLGRHEIEPGGTLELGEIRFEEAGRLAVRLSGIPEEAHESLTAMLSNESNGESGVARLAKGSLTAGPLATGKHLLVLGGEGVVQVRRPFEIEPGLETAFDIVLQPCGTREISFTWPSGAQRPTWIACSLLDASGRLAFGGNAECQEDPPRTRISAAPGNYRLIAGGQGLRGELALEMQEAGATMPPLTLSLQRAP